MKKRKDVCVCIFLTVCIAVGAYTYDNITDGPPPAIFNPVQIDNSPTPADCVVHVSAWNGNKRTYGYGVVVTHEGETFVLTSAMIFTEDYEVVTVDTKDTSQEVEMKYKSEVVGLVALTGVEGLPSIDTNVDPTIPPDVEVMVGTRLAMTAERLNDYWIVLDRELPRDSAGMPVNHFGSLVGVVVGLCSDNTQAIMCGNAGLKWFCDKVNELEAGE